MGGCSQRAGTTRCRRSRVRLHDIIKRHGADAIGGIGSTHTTNEEAYLFQKLLRAGIGTNNVDHYHGCFPTRRA